MPPSSAGGGGALAGGAVAGSAGSVVVRARSPRADHGSVSAKVAPRPSPPRLGVHGAAVQLDQVAHDRQAQAEAAVARASSTSRPGGSDRTRRARKPASMPAPSSSTRTLSPAAPRRIATRTCPPAGVNLIALERRFHITCCSRSPSAAMRPGRRVEVGVDADRLGVGGGAHRVDRRLDDAHRVDLGDAQAQLAGDDARDVEQVLDQLGLQRGVAVDGLERARRVCASRGARRASRRVQPTMALSGVRSSCDSVARNSSLMRLARKSSSLERRIASSTRLRCVMSLTRTTAPVRGP